MGLEGTTAAVWGAGASAEAIASALADAGARVQCGGDGEGPAEVAELIAATAAEGPLDVAVICLPSPSESGPLAELGEAEWEAEIERGLGVAFRGIRAALAAMLPRKAGRIVVATTVEAKMARAGSTPYVAAQHGVAGLVKSVAHEVGRQGVAVNALVCGVVGEAGSAADEDLLQRSALHRGNTPEEVAAAAVLLASPQLSSLTGTLFPVHGGTVPY